MYRLSFLVNVKWGKQKFESVEVNTDEAPEVFQAQMFALSGVPPERQKIMAKGKALKVSYKCSIECFSKVLPLLYFQKSLLYSRCTLCLFIPVF